MSQKHKSKKTLLSPDEKLWRRISSKFGKDEDKWDMAWNSSKIYSFFVEKEKLKLDNKGYKQGQNSYSNRNNVINFNY